MSIGTFDAFTTARLGIYAAQHGLSVTGNNISNINTEGYTRQRLDQVSFKAGAYDRYRSQLENRIGSGALVMNINQIRDPYLDVRFRNTNADVGYNDTMLEGLQHIADIIDEVGLGEDSANNKKGDGRLYAQIQDLADKLRKFSAEPTNDNNDLVRSSASTLTALFHTYANKLESLRKETETDFKDSVTKINECLTNIRDLNREIRDCEIYGDNALELRDERNRQIDKLSEYIHIKVMYSEEFVGSGLSVEKLSIYLNNDNPDSDIHTDESMLIDGIYGAQLYQPEKMPAMNPSYCQSTIVNSALGNLVDPKQAPDAIIDPNPLKDYMYLKDVEVEIPVLDADNNPVIDPGTGQPATQTVTVVQGTNDPLEATYMRDNDYYGLQITKLVDDKNREWESIDTDWKECPDGVVGVNAVFQTKLTETQGWDETKNQSITIGNKTYNITAVTDLTATPPTIAAADANNTASLARIIADTLNNDSTYMNDYTVSAVGNAIQFTAKKAGVVPRSQGGTSQAPLQAPKLTLTGGAGITLTFDPPSGSDAAEVTQGVDEELPNMTNPRPGKTTNPDGSVTEVNYVPNGGKWYSVTTVTKHTQEVALDDNDLYGSLQATRELLTEDGEFTTTDVINNIDENAAKKRGIPYYQHSLDLFARKFAEVYNGLNQGISLDQNGDPIPSEEVITLKTMVAAPTGGPGGLQEVWELTGKFNQTKYDALDGNSPPEKQLDAYGYTRKEPKWLVDPQGYCVDTYNGRNYYTGLHDTGCIIYHKVPIAEYDPKTNLMTNYEEVLAGVRASGFEFSTCDDIKNISDPTEKAKQVDALLKRVLDQHGVNLKFDTDGTPVPTVNVIKTRDVKMGGPLFSNRGDNNDPNGITAANISISLGWSTSDVQLVPKFEILWDGDVEHSTQNINADHMVSMLEKKLVFNPKDIVANADSSKLFEGNFSDMFNNMCTILGNDQRATGIALDTHYTQLVETDSARDGVSGVDLNDEAMNLMQYQKAYSAACRLMTVIDEALDRLINNTGLAGR